MRRESKRQCKSVFTKKDAIRPYEKDWGGDIADWAVDVLGYDRSWASKVRNGSGPVKSAHLRLLCNEIGAPYDEIVRKDEDAAEAQDSSEESRAEESCPPTDAMALEDLSGHLRSIDENISSISDSLTRIEELTRSLYYYLLQKEATI